MISNECYETMKKNYGKVASWAVWAEQGATPKSNVGDLSVFERSDILNIINPGYVFVGLNVAGTGEVLDLPIWSNFHSDYHTHNDYKLRYALKGTPYWGAYITDIIKRHSDSNGEDVMKFLKNNPDVLRDNIRSFKEEIRCLGTKPVLIAMGGKAHRILSENLNAEYTIVPIKHYSYTISKENYRREVLEALSGR